MKKNSAIKGRVLMFYKVLWILSYSAIIDGVLLIVLGIILALTALIIFSALVLGIQIALKEDCFCGGWDE